MGTTSNITIKHVLNFLNNLHDKGVSYSAIVSAKCIWATMIT